MTLLTILGHWALVTATLLGIRGCYALVKMADADHELERKARCREAIERQEEYPAGFRVGSLANPYPTHEGPAYLGHVEDFCPHVVEITR